MNNREKKLQKVQTRVLFRVPFFAAGVAKLPIVWDESIETACTDGRQIRWSPQFFDKCEEQSSDVNVFVNVHEVAHPLLGHNWRGAAMPGIDWEMWNVACDHEVNNCLREFAEQAMAKGLADPFPLPKDLPVCCDPRFKGMSAEHIYRILASEAKPGGNGKGQGPPKPGAGGQGQGGPVMQDVQKPGGSATDQGKAKTEWANTLIQSVYAHEARNRGTLPSTLSKILGDYLNPRVPWDELVRQFLREQAADDWNWMVPNPRFEGTGFVLPAMKSERVSAVYFGIDTSGSIGDTMLSEFRAAEQYALDELQPAKLVEIQCDAQIQSVKEYYPGETVGNECKGRGGTRFEPFFEEIERRGDTPKCLVILTDLYGSFPVEHPNYPVLWVCYSPERSVPFGEVIPCD